MKLYRNVCFIFLILLLASLAERADAYLLHPAFDSTPVKIMDTPDCTYFLVHQQVYDRTLSTYDLPSLTLFLQRKGENRIIPLSRVVKLSDIDIRIAEYLHDSELLFVGYADGGVDLIKGDGSIRYISNLKNNELPGLSVIRGVAENVGCNTLNISTDCGYIEIDTQNYTILSRCESGPISTSFRCGGKILILNQTGICESQVDVPSDINDFRPIEDLENIRKVVSLDENSFACVSGESGGDVKLLKVTNSTEGWKKKLLCHDTFHALPANKVVNDRYEGNFTSTKDGYLISSDSRIWKLSKTGSNEIDCIPVDENMTPVGSWDFENFYTYRNRGKFVRRQYTTDWNDVEEAIRPDAPASFICTHLSYSPGIGTLTINHGVTQRLMNISFVNPVLLSLWDGKCWTTPNQVYNIPDETAINSKFKEEYEKWINRYPVPDPTGMGVDPISPDRVIISSVFGGVAMVDIIHPNRLPIKFCSPADPFASSPGSISCLPNQNWSSFASFSPPVFDADSTAWCSYSNFLGSEENGEGKLQFKYLTAKRRKAIYDSEPEKVKDMENWETLSFPLYESTQCFSLGMAFKHPRSKNFVMVSSQNWGQGLAIINHKGTLNDDTDDEKRLACGYITPDGSKRKFVYAIDMIENESTGELIMADFDTVVMFAPPFNTDEDGYLMGEELNLTRSDSSTVLPGSCNVNKLAFDSFGRLWIGTNNEGLICMSVDRKNIEKRYTKENLGLPSNQIYGMVWNPESGSLMVSTNVGLAEIFPDISSESPDLRDMSSPGIYPTHITPDYNGNLYLRNLPQYTEIRIRNSSGVMVRRIENGPHRYLGYDLEDSNGERLPSGRYSVEIGDGIPLEFIIVS